MAKALVQLLTYLGMPSVAATALAVLISETTPLSLSELAKKTGYAKSHLSPHLKILAANGLISMVRSKKKIIYTARKESIIMLLRSHLENLKAMVNSVSHTLVDQEIRPILNRLSNKLEEVLRELEGGYNG